MHVLKRIPGTRVVSTPEALDRILAGINWPENTYQFRFAEDELFVTPRVTNADAVFAKVDPHAIIISEGAFSGVWIDHEEASKILERSCEWEIPTDRPSFVQGMVAGLPTKLYLAEDKVLFIVPSPYAHEMEERLA